MLSPITLSICITTYNRGNFIAQTLDSLLPQLSPIVELIVVDGCSSDNTEEVMCQYVAKHPEVKYYREQVNSGIDKDYDKAVSYAHGQYCWLMTDDDLVKPSALNTILTKLNGINDLVVVNAEVTTVDFSKILDSKLIRADADQSYTQNDNDRFMTDAGHGLSFIGCVIIKRELWLTRERTAYYGSLFIHVGVIFQQPVLKNIMLIAEPLISIRYGNAMWTPRGLEIWLIKWPNLIWSFNGYSIKAKAAVCPDDFVKKLKRLAFYRASGAYTYTEFKSLLAPQSSCFSTLCYLLIALFPAKLLNMITSVYCAFKTKSMRMALYSLNNSKYQNPVSRWASRVVGV
ncbi:MAG: glycosyl transferase [Methylotenera sp.]|nr:MAG: glycosyl transferase [Methylotenera sp.]